MKLGKDFIFRDDLKKDTVPIQILNCIFEDIVIRYTNVSIIEKETNEAVVRFDYEIIECPEEFVEKKLRSNKQFQEHLGLILNTLILDIVEQSGRNDDNRKNNSEKSS
jgi:molybdopterin/thiamine biosynthesis adenylyltransferase